MKQDIFEQQFTPVWEQFEQQLSLLEKRGGHHADSQALAGFADHYRQICRLLALAQERHYSPYLIDLLNDLALRGHQQFYRRDGNILHNILTFILRGFPTAVRKEYKFVWLAAALFFLPLITMGLLTYHNPNMAYSVYSHSSVQRFVDMYDPVKHAKYTAKRGSSTNLAMFGFYIKNNIGIGFQTFASGILLGIGAIFNLLYNGLTIGAIAGYLTQRGQVDTFWSFVVGHGAFELTGIAISGAAGLKLGFSLLAPGRLSRRQSLMKAAREAMPLVYGMFFFLLIAAFIEAFWSSSGYLPSSAKYLAGGCFWLLVISYLNLGARRGSE